jgi:multisubunit Na+/H+ antiporter MnhF subunit
VLLLLSVAVTLPPIMDVALMLGLLATFVSVAFLRKATDSSTASDRATENQ